MAHIENRVDSTDTAALAEALERMGDSLESLRAGNSIVADAGGWEIVTARLCASQVEREALLGDVLDLSLGIVKNADLLAYIFHTEEQMVAEMGATIMNKACAGRLHEAAGHLGDLAEALSLHYSSLADRTSDPEAQVLCRRWTDIRTRFAPFVEEADV